MKDSRYLRRKYVQLLNDWCVVVLIWLSTAAFAPYFICLFVQVQLPLVDQADMTPQSIRGMLMECLGDLRDVFERRGVKVGNDELEQFAG